MAQLPRDFIQRVLDSTDIVSLIDSHVSLQKRGKDHWALCPFCDDGSKPSFSVSQHKQFYYCFVCNAKGNSIKHPLGFDMQLDDPLDFYAVTDHAAWLGMIRAYADPTTKPGKLDFASDLHGLNDPENLNTNTLGA